MLGFAVVWQSLGLSPASIEGGDEQGVVTLEGGVKAPLERARGHNKSRALSSLESLKQTSS